MSAESGARPQSRPRGVDNGVAGAVILSPGLTPESLRGRQLLSLSLSRPDPEDEMQSELRETDAPHCCNFMNHVGN